MTRASVLRAVTSRQLFAGYVAASALVLGAGGLAYVESQRLAEATEWRAHTLHVMAALDDIRAQLRAAETDQRGFVITGHVHYLTRYTAAAADLTARLDALNVLTRDNQGQQARLRELRPIVNERLTRLRNGAQLRVERGMDAAAQVIATGGGQQLMDDAVRRLEDMEREERRLLVAREEAQRVVTQRSMRALLGSSIVGFALLGGLFYVLVWQTRERREAEARLRGATTTAEEATRAKSEFLANMSHEIRTPLSGILGMLELARATSLNVQQARYISIADASARSLLTLINDVLDLSKVEAGRMEISDAPFDLSVCLQTGLASLALTARRKGLSYSCVIDDDVPRTLTGDAGRLQQILINLVGNAVKFTDRGSVTVRVSSAARRGERVTLLFSVADTGIGIPANRRAAVFEPFTQADNGSDRRQPGTGLGLAIASRLAQMMGGRLELAPAAGTGTTFRFTAVFAVQETVEAPDGGAPAAVGNLRHARPLHILLAEDTESIRIFVEELLRSWGHRVTCVTTGFDAVEAYVAERPDLVLMDVHMPECDGMRATSMLRSRERDTGMRVPIIALTARAMLGDKEACLEGGMDGYLPKPINGTALFEAIAGVAGTAPAAATPPAIDGNRILESLGGDTALLHRISKIFLTESERLERDLIDAIERADRDAVELLAHSLKSSLGHWTMGAAYEAARDIEAAARRRQLDEAASSWRRLQAELPGVRDQVSRLAA